MGTFEDDRSTETDVIHAYTGGQVRHDLYLYIVIHDRKLWTITNEPKTE